MRFFLKKCSIIIFFLIVLYLLFLRILWLPFDHDENLYVSCTALLEKGYIPYRDYYFTHPPLYLLIALPWLKLFSYKLLSLRTFSILCLLITLCIIFYELYKYDIKIAILAILVVLFSPLFVFYTGFARNNDLANLFSLIGLWLLYCQNCSFFSGLFIGASASVRLPFILLTIIGRITLKDKMSIIRFYIGVLLGILPVIYFLIFYRNDFIAHTLIAMIIRKNFYIALGMHNVFGILGRIRSIQSIIKISPDILIWFLISIIFIVYVYFQNKRKALFAFLTITMMFIIALLPTPLWYQYFVIILLACLFIFSTLINEIKIKSKYLYLILSIMFLFNFSKTYFFYYSAIRIFLNDFGDSVPVKFHKLGVTIANILNDDNSRPILTLSTILPVEGGLNFYPEITAVFGWREAPFWQKDARRQHKIFGPEDLDFLIKKRPPIGIVTGLEASFLERPLNLWAKNHGFNLYILKYKQLKIFLWKSS